MRALDQRLPLWGANGGGVRKAGVRACLRSLSGRGVTIEASDRSFRIDSAELAVKPSGEEDTPWLILESPKRSAGLQ